jgi:hypothetical protein
MGPQVTMVRPEFVPFARLQSNLTQLMRKVIGRIEDLANTPNSAADRILGTAATVAAEAANPLGGTRRLLSAISRGQASRPGSGHLRGGSATG